MSRGKAAPDDGGHRGGQIDNSGAASISNLNLPSTIVSRLELAGINTVDEWIALGAERFKLFGITTKVAASVDSAIAEVG